MAISSQTETAEAPDDKGPRPRSLRLRLMLLAAVSIGVTLTITGLLLAYIFEDHIERLTEQDLDARWLELASAFMLDADGNPAIRSELSDPRYRRPAGGAYWRVTEDGVTRLRSRSLWDQDIEPPTVPHLSPTGKATEQRGPNGSTLYMMEREVELGAKPRHFRLAVALDTADVGALRRSFAVQVGLALSLIGLVLFAGAWIQASVGLRPLQSLRRELGRLQQGRTGRLTGRFPEEVAPLVRDLNRLLARQEDLVRKARERAGDLAHGLKTPLTILQSEARKSEMRGEFDTAASLREQITLMRRHIDRELSRARTFGATAAGGTLTDARRSVERIIGLIERMPRGETLSWQNQLPQDLRLRIDPDDFGEVIGNLLDNARKWAKSRVRVLAELGPTAVRISVEDDGPGIPPELRDTILRRGERAGDGEGAGLGLAIVTDVLEQYGTGLGLAGSAFGGLKASFAVPGRIDAAATRRH